MQRQIDAIIDLALSEDIGSGDLTAESVIPESATASGQMLLKSPGVISGLTVVGRVCQRVDPAIAWRPLVEDGCAFETRTVIGEISGPARSVLTAERTALNFIQRLSGVATLTRAFVDAIAGTNARIVDTRKTTPGMRLLEKQAVRHGGGSNHRIGLFDGVMIKDNHIAALGGDRAIGEAVARARSRIPHTVKIEVEVANLDQLRLALDADAEIILLDNMPVAMMREAVAITAGRALLEASGGVNLATVRAIAETGVDLEKARRLWRALGFPEHGPAKAFTRSDARALTTLLSQVDSGLIDFDLAVHLTRAVGQTMARLSDWEVSALSTRVLQLARESGETDDEDRMSIGLRMVEAFSESFEELLGTLSDKAGSLQ